MPVDIDNPDGSSRHHDGSNLVYADGHAKWQRWQNIRWEQTCPAGLNASGRGCAAI